MTIIREKGDLSDHIFIGNLNLATPGIISRIHIVLNTECQTFDGIHISQIFKAYRPLLSRRFHRNMLAPADGVAFHLQFAKQLVYILHIRQKRVDLRPNLFLPRCAFAFSVPLGIAAVFRFLRFGDDRLNAESLTHAVIVLPCTIPGFHVVIKPPACNRVHIQQNVRMNMVLINVRCDDKLCFVPKCFLCKCLRNAMCLLRCDVFFREKDWM